MDYLPSRLPPSSILLLSTFLLISHFPIYGHARRASHIIADKGFKRDCAFDLGRYSFNLCPLAGAVTATTKYSRDHLIKDDRWEGPSSRTRVYQLALGGMMDSLRLTTSNLCDGDTWVCMTDGEEHDFISKNNLRRNLKAQVTPIARRRRTQSHPGKILASIVTKDAESIRFPPLQLSLDGGEAEGRPQSAEIQMLCDFNVESYLEFIKEHDGIHSFRWTTRHGCPTNIEPMYMQPSKLSTTTTDEAEESENKEGDDELHPQPGMSAARRWMAIILVLVVMSILCYSLLFAYPRTRHIAGETTRSLFYSMMPVLSTAAIKLRPFGKSMLALIPQSFLCGVGKPFRQESNQLVRWAEEDMMLHEIDGMMVNGEGEYESWNGDEFNEYIPLTVNPRYGKGKDIKSYGATPDVETFEQQRGLMRGIRRLFGK